MRLFLPVGRLWYLCEGSRILYEIIQPLVEHLKSLLWSCLSHRGWALVSKHTSRLPWLLYWKTRRNTWWRRRWSLHRTFKSKQQRQTLQARQEIEELRGNKLGSRSIVLQNLSFDRIPVLESVFLWYD